MIKAAADVANATMSAALGAVARGVNDNTVKAVAMEAMAAHGVTTGAFEPRVDRTDQQVSVAIGVLREGWEADITRTVPGADRPEALTEAIAWCRPGMAVGRIAADVHGVGLGYEVVRPSDVLEPGMVISIGADGARDTVAITETGSEVLT